MLAGQRSLRQDIAALRNDVVQLRERMAHLEGLLEGLREAHRRPTRGLSRTRRISIRDAHESRLQSDWRGDPVDEATLRAAGCILRRHGDRV